MFLRTQQALLAVFFPHSNQGVMMKNMLVKVEGDIMYIAINLKQNQGRTKSGKATTIAASEGYRRIPECPQYGISLHLYESDKKEDKNGTV